MNKPKVFVAGLVLTALAGILIVLCAPRQPATVWTMPDGSKLRLVKVTYGTNNFCPYGHHLRDLLYPFVPAKYRTNFNFQVALMPSGPAPALVVWMERTGMQTNTASPVPRVTSPFTSPIQPRMVVWGISSYSQPLRISVFDDSGVESPPLGGRTWAFQSGASELEAVVMTQYPRQAKSLGIRVTPNAGDAQPVVEFHVPNPTPPPRYPPVWVAEPLPATRQTNGLEVTLINAETGCKSPAGSGPKSHSRLTLAVKENGHPTSGWNIRRISTRTAISRTNSVSFEQNLTSQNYISLPVPLWLDEPAWGIKLELVQETDFPVQDVWIMPKLPVPEDGRLINLNFTTNLLGVTVTLKSVEYALMNPLPGLSSGFVRESLRGDDRSLLRINLIYQADASVSVSLIEMRDDQGRVLRLMGTRADGQKNFSFVRPVGAKTLTATVGISRSVVVEFIVKPVLAGRDDPSGPLILSVPKTF